ncbi:hypothetical protein C8A05DRAFT_45582 [Staphylotrichum tortipilum]|uniref:Secreted protein n=1 Tax=Staphylotrichum tortipilum TaxID=2831512 RepID=A0AAN6RRS2_9PEZI|nr:hypothetical protein C8A05DRAFT_45582 [Staphylotrichum longicolle]
MRLEIATAVAALAATCAADAMMTFSECNVVSGASCFRDVAIWYTAYGGFPVDPHDGCRGQSNGMVDFCMDWTNYRGHFRFSHESFKRCFERKGGRLAPCYRGLPEEYLCYLDYFEEVGCTWRQVGVEPEATESAPIPLPTTTLTEVNAPRVATATEEGALSSSTFVA